MNHGGPPSGIVVKLGGSLAVSDQLPLWLDTLRQGAGRVVLVPGGGPFADQVRAAQERWGFDETTAHRLALLAMEQFGHLLAGLSSALMPAEDRAAIEAARSRGVIPVWLPTRMVLAAPEIIHSWDVTSDSLAAWLAGQIGVPHLLLIKSVALPAGPVSAATLAGRGFVDGAFPCSLARARVRACCLGPGQQAILGDLLAGDGSQTTEISA